MSAFTTTAPEPREPAARTETASQESGRRGVAQLVSATFARPALRNGTLSLVDQAVVSGTSFVTSVIIGRLGSKEELGVFFLAMTIVYLARGLQEQLISAPYVIYCHARRDEAQVLYTGSSLLHQLGLSGMILLVLLGVQGLLWFGIGPTGLAPVVWILLAALPFLQLREFIRRLAIAHLQMGTATAIDIGVALFQVGGLALLVYFDRLSVTLVFGLMGASCALACCGWFLGRSRPLRCDWSGAVADWWHNWGFARWALASHVVGFATPYLMPWIVTAVRGSAQAGVLAACVSLVGVASMFMTGVATYLTPKAAMAYANGGVGELRHVLRTAALVYACALGAFAIFVLATGDFLLVLVFGDKFAGYGLAMGILALSTVAVSMGLTASTGLWAIDRPAANLPADVCTLMVTLTIVFCLVEPLGVYGAVLADLGGNVTSALVRYATLRRQLKTA
jgi:O-antigen/teichoic acid export membrane protein